MKVHAKHYRTGRWCEFDWEDGRILSVTELNSPSTDNRVPWLAPALFDLQINGGGGVNFSSGKLRVEDVRRVVDLCQKHGIGGFCPTLITQSEEVLGHGFETLCRARNADARIARALPAFHLEGPFISKEDGPRGAHPLAHVRPPDWDEFRRLQDAAEGLIRLVTVAPELPGCIPFIEKLIASRCVVAIGHTAATPSTIRDAVSAGARLSTHLGNGSHALLPRHENYLWEQLDQESLWASIICDGAHLPDAMIRTFVKVKEPSRLVLTCDASSLAGLPAGDYREWEQDLRILEEGKIIVKNSGFLAGSWRFTDFCVGKFLQATGLDLAAGIDLASRQPRKLLGLPPAELEAGASTDLVLFDWAPGSTMEVRKILAM